MDRPVVVKVCNAALDLQAWITPSATCFCSVASKWTPGGQTNCLFSYIYLLFSSHVVGDVGVSNYCAIFSGPRLSFCNFLKSLISSEVLL